MHSTVTFISRRIPASKAGLTPGEFSMSNTITKTFWDSKITTDLGPQNTFSGSPKNNLGKASEAITKKMFDCVCVTGIATKLNAWFDFIEFLHTRS